MLRPAHPIDGRLRYRSSRPRRLRALRPAWTSPDSATFLPAPRRDATTRRSGVATSGLAVHEIADKTDQLQGLVALDSMASAIDHLDAEGRQTSPHLGDVVIGI